MADEINNQPEKLKTQPEVSRGGAGNGNRKTAVGAAENDRSPGIFPSNEDYDSACGLLQVTPNADFEIKSKAFCYLATKYHQDSPATANFVLWEKVLNAWRIVSNHDTTQLDTRPLPASIAYVRVVLGRSTQNPIDGYS